MGQFLVREQRRRVAGVHDLAVVQDDGIAYQPPDDLQVLLDQDEGGDLGGAGERVGDLADDLGRQALGGLVDEQQPVVVEQHAGQ